MMSVNALLGIAVPDDDIVRILKNLDMQPELSGDDARELRRIRIRSCFYLLYPVSHLS